MHRRALALCAAALAAQTACAGDEPESKAATSTSKPAAATSTPAKSSAAKVTKSARPKPAASASISRHPVTSGEPTEDCVNGWRTPERGTALRTFPLDLLRRSQGFKGEFFVHDMRYFKGPEDQGTDSGQAVVERWYAKVTYVKDPSFRLRVLVRRTPVGAGIAAIAPFDTQNYELADWRGFDGEGGRSEFPGLPGTWGGRPTDYAAEGGLPPEVVGCIAE